MLLILPYDYLKISNLQGRVTKMTSLTARLQAVKNQTTEVMYSVAGATFQEWALNRIDYRGSEAHKSIGSLVTAINNNRMTVSEAQTRFTALLVK